MNKKLVALALVLLLAVGGLFAAITVDKDGNSVLGNGNTDVTVTLKGTLGLYFYHGIVESGSYIGSKTITDAFGATAPSFKYGYETNAAGVPYYIRMSVTDFDNKTTNVDGTVKIKNVTASHVSGSLSWDTDTSSYNLYSVPTTNSYTKTDSTITIYPAKLVTDTTDHRSQPITAAQTAAGAPAGEYEATITFIVSAS